VKNQADYDIGLAVQKQSKGAISEQELTKRLGARDESKAGIEKAQAELKNAQLNYGWCKITSPMIGRINRHVVDAGNVVSKDVTTLINIVSLKPIWAYFDVHENSAQAYQRMVKQGEVKSSRTPIAGKVRSSSACGSAERMAAGPSRASWPARSSCCPACKA
jgi:multidrug efflux pump subunit AcrA (membrane-fusion protein)